MKKILFYISCALAMCTSCGDHDIDIDSLVHKLDKNEKEFAEAFEEKYSVPAKTITWMTAACDTVSVDLSKLSGNYKIQFYTADPTDEKSFGYLLAEYNSVAGGAHKTLYFDYPIGLKSTYVSAIASDGTSYSAQIKMSGLNIDDVIIGNTSDVQHVVYPPMRYTMGFEAKTPEGIDFDYNDVVIEIEYVRGRASADIILRAAGSSCWSNLVYRRSGTEKKKNVVEDVIFEENHAALSYPGIYNYASDKNIYYILNTGLNNSGRTARATLALQDDEGASICTIAQKFHAYFKLDDKSKDKGIACSLPDYLGSKCPEALLLAMPNWGWLPEGMGVHVPYPSFRRWVLEPEKYPLWYTTKWDEANEE